MNKVDKVVDDVNDKVQSLNGLFNLIDYTTDKIVSVTDRVVDGVSGFIGSLFGGRRRKNTDDEEEWLMSRRGGLGKFLAGAAIGVGLGILFAPKSGAETRKELKE